MSWLKDEASQNIPLIVVTPEVSHELMSSLKGDKENNHDMSVTPPVAHVEIWPYAASAATRFPSHASTAVLMVLSSIVPRPLPPQFTADTQLTPHVVDAHGVPENASSRPTSLSRHQPRSWSKAEAL